MEQIAAKDLRVGDRVHALNEEKEPEVIELADVWLSDISLPGQEDKIVMATGGRLGDGVFRVFSAPENSGVWVERPKIERKHHDLPD